MLLGIFRTRPTVSLDHPVGSVVAGRDGKTVHQAPTANDGTIDSQHPAGCKEAGKKFYGGGDGKKRMPTIFKYGGSHAKEVYVCGEEILKDRRDIVSRK